MYSDVGSEHFGLPMVLLRQNEIETSMLLQPSNHSGEESINERNYRKLRRGKEPQFKCSFCIYNSYQKVHITRHTLRFHSDMIEKNEDFF